MGGGTRGAGGRLRLSTLPGPLSGGPARKAIKRAPVTQFVLQLICASTHSQNRTQASALSTYCVQLFAHKLWSHIICMPFYNKLWLAVADTQLRAGFQSPMLLDDIVCTVTKTWKRRIDSCTNCCGDTLSLESLICTLG